MAHNKLSHLLGMLVISQKEGSKIGNVEDFIISPDDKAIAAITIKGSSNHLRILPLDEIKLFGRDVILIKSDTFAADTFTTVGDLGRRFKNLKGMSVTTTGGHILGKVYDLSAESKTGTITEIFLSESQMLQIKTADLTMGPDQLVLPAGYEGMIITDEEKPSFFSRIFHSDNSSNSDQEDQQETSDDNSEE